MSGSHVSQASLRRFVDGELADDLAAEIGLHIDTCPACAARAAAAEPLSRAFASVDDPEPPADLVAAIVARARAEADDPLTGREPLVAGALLVASVAILVLAGAPAQVLSSLATLADALGTVIRTVEAPLMLVAPVWAAAAMLTFAAAAMVARRLEGPRAPAWR